MKAFYFLSFIFTLAFTNSGCGSSCDEASLNVAYGEVDSRAQEFFADPTNKAKCQAYVNSLENCIDDMKDCDVDPTKIESYQNSLDSAKEDCK